MYKYNLASSLISQILGLKYTMNCVPIFPNITHVLCVDTTGRSSETAKAHRG
eukprot:TRINITY_DN7775_c0_g1_i1.p3 TRINITY_DN7775_c0_g1~~TRINITY_DN7775_c0_g1_i1.p3  ORF type:complete len:52 (+),score=17.56 TRINITY_DN7775_c0_g1_i1:144-299(+)